MLPAASRLRTPTDFQATMRHGVRSGRPSVVVHARLRTVPPSRAGFVVSKAVGTAVVRNRVKRRLRHLVAAEFRELRTPIDLVVRALPASVDGDLAGDFDSALGQCLRKLAA
ncbi:MAG: ribonuclease P protein component [Propionicimonas sp.]